MTAQTKMNDPIEVSQPIIKQPFSWFLAILIFVAGVGLGVFATNLTKMETKLAAQPVTVKDNQGYAQGSTLTTAAVAAEAARYNGLATSYAIEVEQVDLAWPPRPNLSYLTEKEEVNTPRAIAAETARYKGLVTFYAAEAEQAALAWPPRPDLSYFATNEQINSQQVIAAEAARYSAMAGVYTAPVESGEQQAMKHDREYGLAAFSTTPVESGEQRTMKHDREYGLAAFGATPVDK